MPFEWSENARIVLAKRYLLRNDDNEIVETVDQMWRRVANAVSLAETTPAKQREQSNRFYNVMSEGYFIPNSPTMMNAGTGRGSLSACFVIPIPDTMEGILDAAKAAGMVQKYGGGTGFSGSLLRGRGALVHGTHRSACGPVSVLKHLDDVARLVTQGGAREGANMFILRYDHPDVMDFIRCKDEIESDPSKQISRFNISVGMEKPFFDALTSTDSVGARYYTVDPKYGIDPMNELMARNVFDAMVHGAWKTGDPGMVFLDKMNHWRSNPVPSLGPILATNPCGEQPLYAWDSCNLGSIDLSKLYDPEDRPGQVWAYINTDLLRVTIATAIRFLDNVITVNDYALPEIREMNDWIRRVGLGVMGWADLLYKLHIPYNSERALQLAEELGWYINERAWEASVELAKERGEFPKWAESIYSNDPVYAPDGTNVVPLRWAGVKVRNSTRTTIAPTGTISIIASTSSGIEPNFALAFYRQHHTGDGNAIQLTEEFNPIFEQALIEYGLNETELAALRRHLIGGGRLKDAQALYNLPDEMLEIFVTSQELGYGDHILMQSAWQKNTDNAVSKTINMPNEATEDEIAAAYKMAWTTHCLGITVYRDGSRGQQVLTHAPEEHVEALPIAFVPPASVAGVWGVPVEAVAVAGVATAVAHEEGRSFRKKLPDDRPARTHHFRVGEIEGYLTVGMYADGCPGELFIKIAKEGSTVAGVMDGIGLLTSLALQYGVPVDKLGEKMEHTRFEPMGGTNNQSIPFASSLLDYIFRWLVMEYGEAAVKRVNPTVNLDVDTLAAPGDDTYVVSVGFVSAGVEVAVPTKVPATRLNVGSVCIDCGQPVYQVDGCSKCFVCGWSGC